MRPTASCRLAGLGLATIVTIMLAACGSDTASREADDARARDVELAPSPDGAPLGDRPAEHGATGGAAEPRPERPAPAVASAPRTLAAGTSFAVRTSREINSRANKAGETLTATVGAPVKDARGRVVIPAGSRVTLRIAAIHESENKSDKTGKLALEPASVSIDGRSYELEARVGALPTFLRDRKTNAGDVAKVGAGAGIGAVAGRVVGGSTKGAVIGGVIGGAVGAQRAVETQDRDVVLPANARVTLTLRGPLVVKG